MSLKIDMIDCVRQATPK